MVERLGAGRIEATAELLAEAFDEDAGYRYLFPGPERRAGLADLFRRNLRVHLPHGCTWIWVEQGSVRATVTVRPPSGVPISTLTMVRHGLLPFVRVRGWAATRRLLWLKNTYGQLEHAIATGAPHWHVHMMVVQPSVQGRGIGGRLLGAVLDRTADLDPGRPTVLTTHSERNVTFYRRLGFEVTERRELRPPGAAPYPVWSMHRRQP
ncbi:MAG: GNAT family N-acetyltransferase [Myxococcota bacterium]